jgi:small multidrug resistance pump
MAYLYLGLAIVLEVLATFTLKATGGFTRGGPSLVAILGYAGAFFCLAHVLTSVPVGVAYAVWSGAGMLLITVVGAVCYEERLQASTLIGIAFVLVGIVILRLSTGGSAR